MTSSSVHATMLPFTPGSVIDGKYRVERAIAEGGMGIVVLATHLQLDRPVAIKYLRAHAREVPGVLERFEREARLAAKIKSEHVVRVHDVGVLDGIGPYMVMEYLEGHDLGAFVDHGTLPVDQAVEYVIQACDALAEAHALDIVHRDLKPENLFLVDRSPRAPIVKIIDFGISKVTPKRGEGGAWIQGEDDLGTPFYMSPEQLSGEGGVDARSDIWALGIVLHELLTGTPPFEGATIQELCTNIVTRPPRRLDEVLPDVPAELVAIVLTCLDKTPSRRFDSVASLARALAPFGRGDIPDSAVRIATVVRDAEAVDRKRAPDPRRIAPTVVVTADGGTGRLLVVLAIAVALAGAALVVYFGVIRARPADVAIGAPALDVPAEITPAPPASSVADQTDPAPADTGSATAPPQDPKAIAKKKHGARPSPSSQDPRAQFGERK